MKVTTQQKFLGGLLLVAALGLGADRLFSAKPEADATDVESYAVDAQASSVAMTTIAATTVGQKLSEIETRELQDHTDRDAFVALVVEKPTVAAVKPPSTFTTDHRLTAVVVASGNRGQALVDGKFVTIGQTVGGMRLTAVGHNSATFSDGVEFYQLQMHLPLGAVATAQ